MPNLFDMPRKFHQTRHAKHHDYSHILTHYILPLIAIIVLAIILFMTMGENDIHIQQHEVTINIDADQVLSDYKDAK